MKLIPIPDVDRNPQLWVNVDHLEVHAFFVKNDTTTLAERARGPRI